MKRKWIVIIGLVVVGLLLSAMGFLMGASRAIYWTSKGFSVTGGEISRITEPDLGYFKSIYIDVNFCDVEFISSDKYGFDACGYDMEWDWALENEVLKIAHARRIKYQIMNFGDSSTEKNYVKIYLPADSDLRTVEVKTRSADASLGRFSAESVDISNSFGNVNLYSVTSGEAHIGLNSGTITGTDINARNLLKIDNSFGEVGLRTVTSGLLQIDLNSSDFAGSDINVRNLYHSNRFGKNSFHTVSAERFTADCNSGDLELDRCEFGDMVITSRFMDITARGITSSRADIDVNSGDIRLDGELSGETVIRSRFGGVRLNTSMEKSDYSYDISVKFGNIKFDGDRLGDDTSITGGSGSVHSMKITVSSGDIEVNFAK